MFPIFPPGWRPNNPPQHDRPQHFPGNRPGSHDMPRSAPPDFVPQRAMQGRAVDPGAIRGCLRSFTYVWLRNGQQFWMFPTFVGRQSIAGYRWSGFGWLYTGFDLRLVDGFHCMR